MTCRSLDTIGEGFEKLLDDPTHRNLARAEWAWLDAFHAAEGEALALAALAGIDPETLIAARLALHPARWFALEVPHYLAWDVAGEGDTLLLTRPQTEVLLRRVDSVAADILSLLSKSCAASDLLGAEPTTLIALIDAGAVVLEKLP